MAKDSDDSSEHERGYIAGKRAVWMSLLQEAMTGLGMQGKTLEALVLEREATVAALRTLCEEHGDNDWNEDLHLADVVSKHIYPKATDR